MARVLTLGTFDLPHPGHMYLFEQCRAIAGRKGEVNVAVNPDWFIEKFKGRAPVQTWAERAAILGAVKFIDRIWETPGPDAKPLIEEVNPDFLVIGVDWAPPKDYYGQLQITQEWLADRHIALLYLDRLGDLSSTNLKARIREA
jgi:glycerol-3-phosphate cytidylyltransferase